MTGGSKTWYHVWRTSAEEENRELSDPASRSQEWTLERRMLSVHKQPRARTSWGADSTAAEARIQTFTCSRADPPGPSDPCITKSFSTVRTEIQLNVPTDMKLRHRLLIQKISNRGVTYIHWHFYDAKNQAELNHALFKGIPLGAETMN